MRGWKLVCAPLGPAGSLSSSVKNAVLSQVCLWTRCWGCFQGRSCRAWPPHPSSAWVQRHLWLWQAWRRPL